MEAATKRSILSRSDEKWWDDFSGKTENLSKPVLLDNFSEEVLFTEKSVKKLLNNVSDQPGGLRCLRVFVNGNPRKEFDIKVYRNPPKEHEALEEWFKKIFGDQKFGIVVNDIEQFDDDYTRIFARFIHPLTLKTGIPEGGMDMFIFIGNYANTPFGVHRDIDVTQLFHFQYGPCDKEFSVWEPEDFIEKTGSHYQSHDVDTLKEIGKTYCLKPNSMFFMPGRFYHIGSNRGLTIAMSLAFNKVSSKTLLHNALAASNDHLFLSSTYQKEGCEVSHTPAKDMMNPLFKGISMEEWVNFSLDAFNLSLKSNCGFGTSPLPGTLPEEITSATVRMPKPFQIYLKEVSDKHLIIFARGYRIMVKAFPDMSAFVHTLNSYRTIPSSELFTSYFINWESGYGMKLLKYLISIKALTTISAKDMDH